MRRFTHRHQSGLWDASAQDWDSLASATTQGVGLATMTETTVHHPDVNGRHKIWYPEARDTAAYVSKNYWNIVTSYPVQIATTPYILGGHKPKPPLHCLVVILSDVDNPKRQICVVVVHWPSAIQGEVHNLHFPRIRALYEGLRAVHRIKAHVEAHHPGIAFLLTGDFNLDFALAWVRAFFAARFPSLALSWRHMPARGTHGTRVIDATLYSRKHLRTAGSILGHPHPHFDHTPFKTTYAFRDQT